MIEKCRIRGPRIRSASTECRGRHLGTGLRFCELRSYRVARAYPGKSILRDILQHQDRLTFLLKLALA